MKKGFFLPLLILLISSSVISAELQGIHFKQEGEVSRIELVFDSENIVANKFHNADDKQIFIDLKDVSASDKVVRSFDTSEFSGSIGFVKAYPKSTNPNDIRIAIQLRENVRSLMQKRGNRLVVNVENRFGVFTQTKIEAEEGVKDLVSKKDEGVRIHIPKSDSVEDILANITMSGPKKYIGRKISFNVKNIAVGDILNMIAESSGFNIIITDEVRELPNLSLTLTNVPWDQVLDTVLGLNKLVASKNGAILLITSLEKATKEKELEIKAKKLTLKEEPLVTKVFMLSFSKTKEMKKILEPYVTEERGRIAEDDRNNALIVKDTAGVIEKMRKIIETLDTQTPQVLIESKIIEMSEGYSKAIGLQNGLKFGFDPIGANNGEQILVGRKVDPTNGDIAGPGFSFSSAPSLAAASMFGLQVARFGRLTGLDFQLQLMESENKGKIVSTPKIITQNKKKAVIKSKDTFPYVSSTSVDEGTSEWQDATANLNLIVTPQITNDGSIMMEVEVQKEEFTSLPKVGPPEKTSRNVSTTVLVDNGSTVVIGGIYKVTEDTQHSGVPFIKDLPIIGWLFRTPDTVNKRKSEMVIFLTPRIINQEEAGLTDSES